MLVATRITKRYGGTTVLNNVDFTLDAGQVHAIVGENGAGKSTFVKIVAGIVPHDEYQGSVELEGEPLKLSSVHAGRDAGVVLVPQELHVIPHLSIAENMAAARLPGRGPLYDASAAERAARQALATFDMKIDPREPASKLSPAQRRLIVLAAALHAKARVLIMDEPTAALTDSETDVLLDQIRRCTHSGLGIIYITHRLDELHRIADKVTVLRNGQLVAGYDSVPPKQQLVRDMLGETFDRMAALSHEKPATPTGVSPVLDVRGLSVFAADNAQTPQVLDVSLKVYPGEIVGLYGLVGAGRTELARALYGAWPGKVTGGCMIAGNEGLPRNTHQAAARGLALLAEDRKSQGVLPGQSVRWNMTASKLDDFSLGGPLIDLATEQRYVLDKIRELGVRPGRADAVMDSLSGGNQQKVLIARCLRKNLKVLILDEPTLGVDVGARRDIYEVLRSIARDLQVGILLISSDVDEVLTEADRILVMYKRRLRAEFPRSATTQELLSAATGG